MKKNVFVILIIFMFCNMSIHAGKWEIVQLPDVSNDWTIESISFPSSDKGWAVGSSRFGKRADLTLEGVILKYHKGKWENITPPVVSSNWFLSAVCFVSNDEGWAAGGDIENNKGVILHYKNGNWTQDKVPTTYAYLDEKGWSVDDLSFLNDSEGWAVGGTLQRKGKGGVILHYKNGIWSPEGDKELLKGHVLSCVDAVSAGDVWVGGQNEGKKFNSRDVMVGSTSFSRPWGSFELHSDKSVFVKVKQPVFLKNVIRNKYYFFGPDNGWCVGIFPTTPPNAKEMNYEGRLLQWNGSKWKNIKLDYNSKWWYLEAIDFSSEKNGWIVGYDVKKKKGVLAEYKKGKISFISKKNLPEVSEDWGLFDVANTGENQFWAAGTDYKGSKGVILHYTE
ncbi:MAG: hypothetical protein JEY97_11435 [Bacteroidales bacterium]|nr:hypothetical protein [Bacteroidales bacterium]